jgi:hypothetical protein
MRPASLPWHLTAALIAGATLVALAAVASQPAHAQATCGSGSVSGGSPDTQTVCGNNALANGDYSTAVGYSAGLGSTGSANTAFGAYTGNYVSGDHNNASGFSAGDYVAGSDNTASGRYAGDWVTGTGNTASGYNAGSWVAGSHNVASGYNAGQHVGSSSVSGSGSNDIAIGTNAGSGDMFGGALLGSNTISIGTNATASVDNSAAIGNGATAAYAGSFAIGNGVTTTAENQISIGTISNTYTFAGVTSAGSTAAQSGAIEIVTTDASGNLAAQSLSSLLGAAQAELGGGATIGSGPGTLSVNSSGQITNGLAVTGGNVTIGSGDTQTTIFQNGNATVGNLLTVRNGIQSNGTIQVGLTSTGITLNTDGSSTFNTGIFVPSAPGGSPAAGGTTINNAGIVIGDSRTYISSATGTVIVNASASNTATGHSTVLDGGNGNVTVGGAFAVANAGINVDMGGNAVHGVAAPVLGTDAANKAYVDTGLNAANQRIGRANEGIAIAMALATPPFQPGQRFVVQSGWGSFEGGNAFGLTAAGLIGRDVLGPGTTVTLVGGLGAGAAMGTVSGRAAVAFGW